MSYVIRIKTATGCGFYCGKSKGKAIISGLDDAKRYSSAWRAVSAAKKLKRCGNVRQMYVLDEQGCDMCRDWMMMECENCDLEGMNKVKDLARKLTEVQK